MKIRQSIAAALVAAALMIPAQFAVAQDAELINLNTASAEEIAAVPGMTLEMAAEILKYREDMGDLQNLDELLTIPGISKELLREVQGYFSIDGVTAECSC